LCSPARPPLAQIGGVPIADVGSSGALGTGEMVACVEIPPDRVAAHASPTRDLADGMPFPVQRDDALIASVPACFNCDMLALRSLRLPRWRRWPRRGRWVGRSWGVWRLIWRRGLPVWLSSLDSQGDPAQHAMLARQEPIQRHPQVLQQVEAVGHLHGLWCCLSCTFGERPAAIPTHDLHLRSTVRAKPGGERGRFPVGQEVDHPMLLEVHQDRPVAHAPPQGKAVDPEHAKRE